METLKGHELFSKWNIDAQEANAIQGWTVAIVGTKRSAYAAFKGGETYNENEAIVLNKQDASNLMCSRYGGTDLWKYTRLVAVRGDQALMLPTGLGF